MNTCLISELEQLNDKLIETYDLGLPTDDIEERIYEIKLELFDNNPGYEITNKP